MIFLRDDYTYTRVVASFWATKRTTIKLKFNLPPIVDSEERKKKLPIVGSFQFVIQWINNICTTSPKENTYILLLKGYLLVTTLIASCLTGLTGSSRPNAFALLNLYTWSAREAPRRRITRKVWLLGICREKQKQNNRYKITSGITMSGDLKSCSAF